MHAHVVEEGFISIRAISPEFCDQPQFQANHGDTVRPARDQDVVLPRAAADAFHPVRVGLLLNGAHAHVNPVHVVIDVVLRSFREP
jgi:hypothetical protein